MPNSMNSGKARWILIADDDRDFAHALKTSLEKNGFRVLMCHDAASASQALMNQKFACAVMDNNMGGVDGATIVSEIKKNKFHLNNYTPMIFMSGDLQPDVLKRVARYIDGAFVKPFSVRELVDKINSATEPKTMMRTAP